MRYFVAVAEELHFGRAAQRLGMSQPPLSQQIKVLEKSMGVALFVRSKHSVRLTRSGEAVLAEAYRLLEQAERVRSVAARAEEGITALVNVGCLSSAFFAVLPAIVADLRARHPQIDLALVDVETSSGVESLLQGKLDVAMVRPEKVPAPLRMQALMPDRLMAAVPESHPLAARKQVKLKNLAGEPLVAFARRNLPRRYDDIIAACLKEGFSPNIAYHCASIQSEIGCVACGMGIALVPSLVRHWQIPGVVYRDLVPAIPLTDLALVWNGNTRSEAVQRFIEAAARALAVPPPTE